MAQDVQSLQVAVPDAEPRPKQVLGTIALVFSLLGLGLSCACTVGFVLPGLSFDAWFYLVAFGALGVFPGLVGLVLGLVAYVSARRRGRRERISRWAAGLGAIALLLFGSTLLVAQIYLRLT